MTTTEPSVREELFGPAHRAVTIGIVLTISLIAFEAMGVGTAMPALVADLGSVETYAWPFVAFIASTVVGTVLAGRWCDAHGPRMPLLVGPVLFGGGLLLAGLSPSMTPLLAGRVLQGFASGGLGVGVYVLIAVVYPRHARPAVFALLSASWVLPSLVGPPVAGFVTERFSWHWVFLGLVPLVVVAVLLVLPAVAGLRAPDGEPPAARPGLVPAAITASVAVSALTWAAEDPRGGRLAVVVGSVVLLALALVRVLPAGTPRAGAGIGAVVAGRWLVSGAFFTANAYLPLTLTTTHGWSLTAAGAPLIVGSLGWSAASTWQGRRPGLPRATLLRVGFALVAVGLALLVPVTLGGVPWLAFVGLTLSGAGMGLSYSSLSFLMLAHSEQQEVGFHSSSVQLADQMSQAVFVGLGGALLAVLVPTVALPALVAGLVGLAVLGFGISPRTRET
ncbi:MFS transporter [Nocardioides aurantiacus]|uniref:Putative MFS family arabinose efflux permease n=1 Tax=Nocardioides aurantiacus TaxID=86796 RepID=A0A3N2CSI8_9ACTN|nr:MFS transporter [Nocardioides aurantiacus]ROR90204.1 putative MFS family arabinose efflux permease [Nocardioides aurantiacus]